MKPGQTKWATPIVFELRKDGSFWLCVGNRKIYNQIRRDLYCISRMNKCIDSLSKTTVFIPLDASNKYWQGKIEDEDQYKAALTSRHGLYHLARVQFSSKNAPETFLRNTDIILASVALQFVLVNLDNICTFSSTSKKHIDLYYHVLTLLQRAGATFKLKKSFPSRTRSTTWGT